MINPLSYVAGAAIGITAAIGGTGSHDHHAKAPTPSIDATAVVDTVIGQAGPIDDHWPIPDPPRIPIPDPGGCNSRPVPPDMEGPTVCWPPVSLPVEEKPVEGKPVDEKPLDTDTAGT